MAEPPGQYSTDKMGLAPSSKDYATQLLQEENLGSGSASQSGQVKPDFNPNLWLVREDAGNLRGVDVGAIGAQSVQEEQEFLFPEIAATQQQMQSDNALAYALLTENSSLLGLAVDKNGFTQNYLSGAIVYGDTRNWAIQSTQYNMMMANSWYKSNPSDRGRLSVPEAARKFLEASGVNINTKDLEAAAMKVASGGGGGGAPSTVSTVKKIDGQNLRSQTDQIARKTIGRTMGVGEANKMAKTLNKESAKNPAVNTGLGTANQTQKPGYNFAQGARDELLQTSDARAYQAVVRGVNILGRVLGSQT